MREVRVHPTSEQLLMQSSVTSSKIRFKTVFPTLTQMVWEWFPFSRIGRSSKKKPNYKHGYNIPEPSDTLLPLKQPHYPEQLFRVFCKTLSVKQRIKKAR